MATGTIQPFETRSEKRWEVFSELMILLFNYFLFCFQDLVQDTETYVNLGWLVIVFLIFGASV